MSARSKGATGANPLFVLYGSATGNAEHIAKDLAKAYETTLSTSGPRCFDSVVCCELDQFKRKCLPVWQVASTTTQKHGLLVVVSTTGNGDPPENAGRFCRHIKKLPHDGTIDAAFGNVAFAVLGLGDTNYDQFCSVSKLIDRKLDEVGGTRVRSLACADEAIGLEDVVEPWTTSILSAMEAACQTSVATAAPVPVDEIVAETNGVSTDAVPDPVSSIDATPVIPKSSTSLGVEMVLSQLSLLLGDSDSVDPIDPTALLQRCHVDPSTVGSTTHRTTCTILPTHSETGESLLWRPRGNSVSGSAAAPDSVSSVSAGYHYTARHPFDSTLLHARYLTQTSTAAAMKVVSDYRANDTNGHSSVPQISDESWLPRAHTTYDETFGLHPTTTSPDDILKNGKRVVEVTLSLPDDYTLEYAPGDSLGLLVDNTPDAVAFVLHALQTHHSLLPAQLVSMDEAEPISVETVVTREMDLCSVVKNKRILLALAQAATDPVEQACLQILGASKNEIAEALFTSMIDAQRFNVVDVLRAFPSTQGISLLELVNVVPSIPPRYYSVSSSPLYQRNHPSSDHPHLSLTVAFSVVDYLTPPFPSHQTGAELGQRRIRGTATRYLEALSSFLLASNGATSVSPAPTVRIFPKPTADFRLPAMMSTPVVLIGPGTGIAPFMGFLQHRHAQSQSSDESVEAAAAAQTVVEGTWRGGFDLVENELTLSKKDHSGLNRGADFRSTGHTGTGAAMAVTSGSIDVFFGCRHADHDWLYRDELQAFVESGLVSNLYTAFSRDVEGDAKRHKYVQHIMLADPDCGRRLVDLILHQDASVYVCGDGNAMAKDVQGALVELLSADETFQNDIDQAKAYLEDMKKKQRFLMDIWS